MKRAHCCMALQGKLPRDGVPCQKMRPTHSTWAWSSRACKGRLRSQRSILDPRWKIGSTSGRTCRERNWAVTLMGHLLKMHLIPSLRMGRCWMLGRLAH
jgi:hypothetical protein